MISTITYSPEEIRINPREVLRYLGYTREGMSDEYISKASLCAMEAQKYYEPKACYGRYTIEITDEETILMPYGEIKSRNLAANLKGCSEIYIFAATIGVGFDRGVKLATVKSMSNGAIFNACGAAAVEEVCDILNESLARESINRGEKLHPRFSPGYGDLALENQKGIFDILNPPLHIGLTLRDTLIMAPEKSVTAIIGIERTNR